MQINVTPDIQYVFVFKPRLNEALMITVEGESEVLANSLFPTRGSIAKVNGMAALDFPESLLSLFLFLANQFRPAALRLD